MNSKLHVIIKTEDYKKLQEEARENQITLSALCRLKLLSRPRLASLYILLRKVLHNEEKFTTAYTS